MGQEEEGIYPRGVHAGAIDMGQYDIRFERLKSSSFDPQALWERINGDMELLRELVGIFQKEYPALLKSIAVAIERGACEDVQKFSHKLKGSALQFSGLGVASLAASLEQMGLENSLQGASQLFTGLEREVEALIRSLQTIAHEKGESTNG